MGELMVKDEAMLERIAGLANDEDLGGTATQIPVLKINYDPDAKHPRGAWVVGQTKDKDGNITDHGKMVKGLVVLAARNRWSYYVQGDTKKNCNSPFFMNEERGLVRGSNYGYICGGQTCPYADKDKTPHCKNQWVYFGLALTEDNQLVECLSYLGGASWMPAKEYIDTLKKLTLKGHRLPPYSVLTILGSRKEKNSGTTFFVAELKYHNMLFPEKQVLEFKKKQEAALNYIKTVNRMISEASASSTGARPVMPEVLDAPVTPMRDVTPPTPPVMPSPATAHDDIPPFEIPSFAAPAPEAPEIPSGDAGDPADFDIDEAIKSALAETKKAA